MGFSNGAGSYFIIFHRNYLENLSFCSSWVIFLDFASLRGQTELRKVYLPWRVSQWEWWTLWMKLLCSVQCPWLVVWNMAILFYMWISHHIRNVIIPTDFHGFIFFRGVGPGRYTTNQFHVWRNRQTLTRIIWMDVSWNLSSSTIWVATTFKSIWSKTYYTLSIGISPY
jgi:hypothetical protein